MEALALVILALGVIYFALRFKGFRSVLLKVAGGIAAVIVAVTVIVVVASPFMQRQVEEQQRIARTLIPASQIVIVDARLSYDYSWHLSAVVTNNSPHELTALALKVQITDCPPDPAAALANTKCGVVGEDVVHDYSFRVPSHQKRAMNAFVSFPDLPKLTQWSWHYGIEFIDGKD